MGHVRVRVRCAPRTARLWKYWTPTREIRAICCPERYGQSREVQIVGLCFCLFMLFLNTAERLWDRVMQCHGNILSLSLFAYSLLDHVCWTSKLHMAMDPLDHFHSISRPMVRKRSAGNERTDERMSREVGRRNDDENEATQHESGRTDAAMSASPLPSDVW